MRSGNVQGIYTPFEHDIHTLYKLGNYHALQAMIPHYNGHCYVTQAANFGDSMLRHNARLVHLHVASLSR